MISVLCISVLQHIFCPLCHPSPGKRDLHTVRGSSSPEGWTCRGFIHAVGPAQCTQLNYSIFLPPCDKDSSP